MRATRFDNNLWKYRKISGLKQKELAYLVGIKNIAQISRWEKGERMPSLGNSLKLATIYGRSAEDLFFDLHHDAKKTIQSKKKRLHRVKLAHSSSHV